MNVPLKISVVTPSFNQASFLEKAIRSVIEQDYEPIEYIVMDGGSTDGSVDILKNYSHKIAFWCSEKDDGQAEALAKGFRRATGDILCWLNSDDVFLPGALKKVANFFSRHRTAETACGGAYIIDREGRPVRRFGHYTLGVRATFDRFRFYGQDGIYQQATFWRRSAYEAVGGVDPNLQFIMDRELFTRLARRSPFHRIPAFLACFRIHDDCKTCRMADVQRRESEAFFERYGYTQYNRLQQLGLYWRYRAPSLIRKAGLFALVQLGVLQLKSV